MWPYASPPIDMLEPCDDWDADGEPDGCWIEHLWYPWHFYGGCMSGIPGTIVPPCSTEGWADPDGNTVWTGFYGGKNVAMARYYFPGGALVPPTSIGARILGQELDDHFGSAVGSDGTWLYISAPEHTALQDDVPALQQAVVPGDRNHSGVVYQLRARTGVPGQPNLSQLWIEPGTRPDPNDPNTLLSIRWPYLDAEIPNRTDFTMPVPHQYIIETVGSTRGKYWDDDDPNYQHVAYEDLEECPDGPLDEIVESLGKAWATIDDIEFTAIATAPLVGGYRPYPTDSAGYNMERTWQIVGPHEGAKLSFVHGLGFVDEDGVRDFAVGSAQVREPDPNDPDFGNPVGAIYIISGRTLGIEGDYLLENLQLAPGAQNRLKGLMLKGSSTGETLARVFDDAGDFNGDGYDDVIVGNDGAAGGTGEVIIILGSPHLSSPEHGWTVDGIVGAGHAIRLRGAATGELAGANVAGAGDVDGDGFDDVLIAAPGAEGGAGAVYLVYGSDTLSGEINLSTVGTVDLPAVKFAGRAVGDDLGGGAKTITNTAPGGGSATAFSRGVARLGDIDGDGRDDYAISAMLADTIDGIDAGEIYIIYGRGD